MSEGRVSEAGRSELFARQQNSALAEEAREASLGFADFAHLRLLMGEDDPERAWAAYYAATQPGLRAVLDALLGTFPLDEREKAAELAGSVEAFCLPSNAPKSLVFENPGEADGYLIGISLLAVQLSTDIAWGMSLIHPEDPDDLPPGWDPDAGRALLDRQIGQYVRAIEDPAGGPLPESLTHYALRGRRQSDWPHGRAPRDYSMAAMNFAVAHELAHIEHGDLLPHARERANLLLPPATAAELGVSDEMNEELAADAATFMTCYNLMFGAWTFAQAGSEGPDARERARMALCGAHRAAEACQAYYTAVCLLGMIAWRRGDEEGEGGASALLSTVFRGPLVQLYVQRDREERMVPKLGPELWTENDVAYRRAHDAWRAHCVEDVLPRVWAELGLAVPDTLPDLPVGDMYEPERLVRASATAAGSGSGAGSPSASAKEGAGAGGQEQGGEVDSYPVPDGKVERHTAALRRLTELVGPDDPRVLDFRRINAELRGAEGDPVGARTACEQVVADLTRVQGREHHDTLNARNTLANLRGHAGDPRGAATAYAELATDAARVLGADHLLTLAARYGVAAWRGESGEAGEAVGRLTVLLADYERLLGAAHPVTARARADLEGWRARAAR